MSGGAGAGTWQSLSASRALTALSRHPEAQRQEVLKAWVRLARDLLGNWGEERPVLSPAGFLGLLFAGAEDCVLKSYLRHTCH